jgi:hypothetical protein
MRYILAVLAALFAFSFDVKMQREQIASESEQVREQGGSVEFALHPVENVTTLNLQDEVDVPENRTLATLIEKGDLGEISAPPRDFCEALKEAAEQSDIPIAFFARLLWQESRFQSQEKSSAGAQGVAQFMPATAAEVGLDDPFDPFKALPASARFLRKLHDQFGNLGLAAAAYNAGSGRIQKWLSRQGPLPKETRAYVRIVTGNAAEDWTEESKPVALRTQLPREAPCEGTGGLSKTASSVANVPVVLAPSISVIIKKGEAEAQRIESAKLAAAADRSAITAARERPRKVSVKRFALNRGRTKVVAVLRPESKATLHRAKTAKPSSRLRVAFALNR